MDTSDALKVLIEDAVKRAIQPLEGEVANLRAELETVKAQLGRGELGSSVPVPSSAAQPPSQTVSSQPETVPRVADEASDSDGDTNSSSLPVNTEVPAERTDFMRFLQRGLEQEEKEYAKEPESKPEKKPGWNPFKR
jgi:hypothetical protein